MSGTPLVRSRTTSFDLSGNPILPTRKFRNGWTTEQEKLMSEWADKAQCYRWLHDRCEKEFSSKNAWMTIPVIILSTITGTANFAIGSLIGEDADNQKYAQAAIGTVSLFAGILTTIGNFLRFAQGSEAHRVAGIAWGKFQRQIAVELAIHPNERIDCMDFLKICRAELDRLIEQSPPIPDRVLEEFDREFKDVKDVKKPEICNGLEHTRAFDDSHIRLRQLTAEATLTILHKKKMLREEVLPDLDKIVNKVVVDKLMDISGNLVTLQQRKEEAERSLQSLERRGIPLPEPGGSAAAPKLTTFEHYWKRLPRVHGNQGQGPPATPATPASPASPATTRSPQKSLSDIHIDIVGTPTLADVRVTDL